MGDCPTSEALAEYLEGGLPPERRQRLEEHLAGCPDCCTSFAQASLFMHDEHEAERVAAWWARDYGPGSGIAAGVSLLVAATAVLLSQSVHSPPQPEMARAFWDQPVAVAAALDPSAPRLTGGRQWAALVSVTDRSSEPRRGISRRLSDPVLASTAAARLRDEQVDAIVTSLQRALAADPDSAARRSDLGAALLARFAAAGGDGEDLPDALEAIETALAASPRRSETLYNRALALEEAQLPQSAQRAWQSYLQVDSHSPWADEARRRLAALTQTPPPDRHRLRAELAAAGAGGDDGRVTQLVQQFRSLARQTVQEELLPGWGAAVLAGDQGEGVRQLAAARAVAAEWEGQTADSTLRLAVEEAEHANGALRAALAHGYQAFGEASRDFARYEFAPARLAAERALRELPPTSPAATWALVLRLACSAYLGGDAVREANVIAARPALATDFASRGRLEWILGWWRSNHGDLAGALGSYRDALAGYERLDEADGVAWMQFLTGEVYGYGGQAAQGWSYRRLALAAVPRLVDRDHAFSILVASAVLALAEGRPHVAAALLDETLATPDFDEPQQMAQATLWLCRVRAALGNAKEAQADLQRAAAWASQIEGADRDRIAGDLHAAEGMVATDPNRAVAAFTRALAELGANGREFRLPGVLLERARARLRAGDIADADADLQRGMDLLDRQSTGMGGEVLAMARLEGRDSILDERVRIALMQGQPERAFALAEGGRARGLQAGPEAPRAAAFATSPAAIGTQLEAGRTLLVYAVLGDRLGLWRIARGAQTWVPLPAAPGEVAQLTTLLRTDLAAGAWTSTTRRAAARLYAVLIAPARVAGDGALVVVPDEELHALPFAALVNPATGRFLVEEHDLGVAPSATAYLRGRERWRSRDDAPPQSALVVGDPETDRLLLPDLVPLPGARDEARQVASLYPRRELLLGRAATRDAFVRDAAGRDVLHFAGHAVTNRVAAERSSLALAADGVVADGALTVEEIAAMHLDGVRTVVLSSCDSAGGPSVAGEGPLSLARAFLQAGAPSVVASLWAVPDRPTTPLISGFHRHLRKGDDPAAALRAAQLELLRGPQPTLRSPAVWAVFEAFGG